MDYQQYVDFDKGLVDRRIFTDQEIFDLEMERIFARAWNFVVHESQIPNVGDYFMNQIGSDRVIAVRNKQKEVSVLINSCTHRGNAVCRAEQGNTRTFLCPYHGWSFGLDGALVGVPGLKDFYRGGLDKEKLGLDQAAQVASYKGFVFATMDPDAVPLEEYLGDVGRVGLSLVAKNGDVEVVDGIQKNVVGCNWKLAVDNLYDWYHPPISHKSGVLSDYAPVFRDPDVFKPHKQMVMLGEYGHGIGGPHWTADEVEQFMQPDAELDPTFAPRLDPALSSEMGEVGIRSNGHPNLFPNLWVTLGGMQVCLRIPKDPLHTELWWFTFVPKDAPDEIRKMVVGFTTHTFGPAGLIEQDDGENWEQCTRGSLGVVNRRRRHHMAMGLGKDEVLEDGGQARVETVVNEHGQRWTYQAWADWMSAKDWPELKAQHTPVPRGTI